MVKTNIKIYSRYSSQVKKRKLYSSFFRLGPNRPARTVSASGPPPNPQEPPQALSGIGSSSSGGTWHSSRSFDASGNGRHVNIVYPHEYTSEEADIEQFVARPQTSSEKLKSEFRLKRKVSQLPSVVSISEYTDERRPQDDRLDVNRMETLLASKTSQERKCRTLCI